MINNSLITTAKTFLLALALLFFLAGFTTNLPQGNLLTAVANAGQQAIWTNDSGDFVWDENSENWDVTGAGDERFMNDDTVLFGDDGAGSIAVGTGLSVTDMTIDNTAGTAHAYTFTGAGLVSGVTFTKEGTGEVNFNQTAGNGFNAAHLSGGRVNLVGNVGALGSATVTFSNNSVLGLADTMVFTNPISLGSGGGTLAVDSGTATATGIVSNTGGLGKIGVGKLILTGVNTYTGVTTISAGTLALESSGSIAASSGVDLGATGSFDISATNSGATVKKLTGAGGSTISLGTKNLTLGSGTDNITGSVASAVSGSGSLIVNGTGTLTLTGNNSSYTGATSINTGSGIVATNANALGSGNVVNSGSLELNLASAGTIANVISGAGSLSTTGAGIVTLTGNNSSYTGTTSINSGGGIVATNANALGSGTVVNNGSLGLNLATAGTIANVISGAGSLSSTGAGSVTLTGNNTSYTGTTNINSGSGIIASNANALGNGTVVNNGSLGLNLATAGTIANVISGAGSLSSTGAGIVTLTGNNASYTGTTSINSGGGIVATNANALGSGNVVNNGSLELNLATAGTIANSISGTGSLSKSGAGSVTLNNSLNQNNVTLANGGLTLAAGKSITASGVFTAAAGTTLGVAASSATNTISANTVNLANGMNLVADLNGAAAATAALTVNATTLNIATTINVNATFSTLADGTYTIIDAGTFDFAGKYVGKINGNNATPSPNPRYGTLEYSHATPGKLLLLKAGEDSARTATWNGSTNHDWDEAANNWDLSGGSSYHMFKNGDNAVFADAGNGLVAVGAGLAVAALTVENAAGKDYTFTGSGIGVAASQAGTFTKKGAGTVTFTQDQGSVNAFTHASLEGGRVNLTSDADALGNGGVDFSNNAVLGLADGLDFAHAISLGTGGGTLAVETGASATYSGAISGAGGFSKSGAGMLNLTGASSSYSGAVKIAAGTLKLLTDNALGSGAIQNNGILDAACDGTLANSVSGDGAFKKTAAAPSSWPTP